MILKPQPLGNYFDRYLNLSNDADLISGFKRQTNETLQLLAPFTEEQWNYRYAEGKWSIKEILIHLMDTERVFAYRALRFARLDKTPLPSYDENHFAANCMADERTVKSILEEYMVVRTCTVAMFVNFHESVLNHVGIASDYQITPAGLGFIILGHEMHHTNVIRDRYMK